MWFKDRTQDRRTDLGRLGDGEKNNEFIRDDERERSQKTFLGFTEI